MPHGVLTRLAPHVLLAGIVALLVLSVLPQSSGDAGAPPKVAPSSSVAAFSTPLPTYTVQPFNASSDGWPLSYEEWLPAGYNASRDYPLIVYLDGLSCNNQTWLKGGRPSQLLDHLSGSSPVVNATRGLLTNSSALGYILIAPNTRTCAGFSINSACGGPQGQDLQDAIDHEESLRRIDTTRLYIVATSAGAEGAVEYVAQHPHVIRGLAISDTALDLFEEFQFLLSQAYRGNTGAEDNIDAIAGLDCGEYPSPSNSSAVQLFEQLSAARLDPQALNGTPIWVAAGGADSTTPDNLHSWPYLQVNNTFVNSTCLVAEDLGEPPNCTTTMAALNAQDPTNFSFRFVYEPSAIHGLGQMIPADILAFFAGEVPGGYYVAKGYPMGPVTPANGFGYRQPPPPAYLVQINEVGLPSGTPWQVTLDGQTDHSSSSSLQFTETDGTYAYTVGAETGYVPVPPGFVVVNGSNVEIQVAYRPVPSFPVTFNESGLPNGTTWSVVLNGTPLMSNSSSISSLLPNGSYPYEVEDAGTDAPSEGAGSVVVDGAPVTVNVSYTQPSVYPLYLNETGLPYGSPWAIDIGGRAIDLNGSSVALNLTNGSYPFEVVPVASFAADPPQGLLSIDGAATWLNISFSSTAEFVATFDENGLPEGTVWGVIVAGVPTRSDGPSVAVSLANGTYDYTVEPIAGYSSSPGGQLVVAGAAALVNVSFEELSYNVSFVETGLPQGTAWQVALGNQTNASVDPYINFSSTAGSFGYSIAPVPGYLPVGNGTVVVADGPLQVLIAFHPVPTYLVTFSETGLPAGTTWSLDFSGVNWSVTGGTVAVTVPNGTYAYSVGAGNQYEASPSQGSIGVSGAPLGVTIVFTEVTYGVSFTETGLPSKTSWSVTVQSSTYTSTAKSFVVDLPNGTFAYAVGVVPGYASTGRGNVTVSGAPVGVTVAFLKQVDYTVKFSQSGLKTGLTWSVALGGRTVNATAPSGLSFSVPNGSYPYAVTPIGGYRSSPSSGSLTIAGAGQTIHVTFTAVDYKLTFSETGLPTGTHWKVTVGPSSNSSGTASITFEVPNGSYAYSFGAVAGYTTPAGGTLSVTGSPVNVPVRYTLIPTYSVKFTETGLPKSTVWSLTVNGKETNISATSSTTKLSNGTYAYSVAATGYSASPSSGTVTVNGSSIGVAVTFTKLAATHGSSRVSEGSSAIPSLRDRPED